MAVDLSSSDLAIFERAQRTGDISEFTERFFRLPMSGTWYTTQDRVEQYAMLHGLWQKKGKPDDEVTLLVGDTQQPTTFRVIYDPYYGDNPMFLLPHGFLPLPWLDAFCSPLTSLALAITGTGSGKTCGIAIAMLAYGALYPGFSALNVAPTGYQASLMLGEISKWCSPGSPFRDMGFIKPSRGANDLWIERPYPLVTIEVWPGWPSTLVCQTVGRDANNILGSERDWINCDEAQLLMNIETTEPKLTTRLRGTRPTGVLRWGKLSWITNPGPNPELVILQEKYEALQKHGDEDVLVIEGLDSSVNIYITQRQLNQQKRTMSQRQQDRWHGGQMAAAFADSEIDERLLEFCHTPRMDALVKETGHRDDEVGLYHYETPWEPEHAYIVVGDAGKKDRLSLNVNNVPVAMVFDITGFLERAHTIKLAAFYWLDGAGSYKTFLRCMKHAMLRYHAAGYYDATNVQTAFEDLGREDGFEGWPTTPCFFSGVAAVKKWAITIFVQLMQDRYFEWPYIRGLWHQARIFDPSKRNLADDIIACILVLCHAFRLETIFWDRLVELYRWEVDDDDEVARAAEAVTYAGEDDRYARLAP